MGHLGIYTRSPRPPQPLHLQATHQPALLGGWMDGPEGPAYHRPHAWGASSSFTDPHPQVPPAWKGQLEPGRNPCILKRVPSLTRPAKGPGPAVGTAPPTQCPQLWVSGQMLLLAEAEEASLHLAVPAPAAALPSGGHLQRPLSLSPEGHLV